MLPQSQEEVSLSFCASMETYLNPSQDMIIFFLSVIVLNCYLINMPAVKVITSYSEIIMSIHVEYLNEF